MRLVLASRSPRRAELMRAAGFAFDVFAVDVDETVQPGESPAVYVRRLAREKSAAAQRLLPDADDLVVIGADTTVVVGDEILGKPIDDRDAERMLRRLSGRRHEVLTGVSMRRRAVELGGVDATAVEVVRLRSDDISWYLGSGEGRDKAGAYAIQGLASRFVTRIDGSYSNVVGLPMHTVFSLLRELQ